MIISNQELSRYMRDWNCYRDITCTTYFHVSDRHFTMPEDRLTVSGALADIISEWRSITSDRPHVQLGDFPRLTTPAQRTNGSGGLFWIVRLFKR